MRWERVENHMLRHTLGSAAAERRTHNQNIGQVVLTAANIVPFPPGGGRLGWGDEGPGVEVSPCFTPTRTLPRRGGGNRAVRALQPMTCPVFQARAFWRIAVVQAADRLAVCE